MSQPERWTTGGVRWHVAPEPPAGLAGPLRVHSAGEIGSADWLAHFRGAVVKSGPHRAVYRLDLPRLTVYLKHCRLFNLRAWLREWLRPPKARLEFDRARELTRRGVATVVPLAWGVSTSNSSRPADSFLVTAAAGGGPLSDYLDAHKSDLSPKQRQRLAIDLGRFLAGVHSAGVAHPDPHPGNILVEVGRNDDFQFRLLDVHAVVLRQESLDWASSCDNLVLLNRYFILRASRADRLRFWRAYAAGRRLAVPADAPRELERATWRSNGRFWATRDGRCTGDNRYFRRVRSECANGFGVRDLDADLMRRLADDPDAPFAQPGVELLKDSRSSTVATLMLPDGREAVYKRFRVTSKLDPLLNRLRPSQALRSWRLGHGLIDRWLPTPRPLLVLHRRRVGLPAEGYVLFEKLPDAVDLHTHAGRLAALPGARRSAVEAAARLVRGLHERGLSHRDLKAANILHSSAAQDRPGMTGYAGLWLVDLVGVSRPRRLSPARRVQNLARLAASFRAGGAVSRSDKLRFLRVYMAWGLFGKRGWKVWWRAVAEAVARKEERNRRRGRALT